MRIDAAFPVAAARVWNCLPQHVSFHLPKPSEDSPLQPLLSSCQAREVISSLRLFLLLLLLLLLLLCFVHTTRVDVAWSVCRSVCLSVTIVSAAKTAEPIEIWFELCPGGPKEPWIIDGGADPPHRKGQFAGEGAAHCKV